MVQLTISQDICPVSDLETKGREIVSRANDTGRPIVLTNDGRGVAVLLGVDEFERLQEAAEGNALTRALSEGEEDIAAGRTISHEAMRAKWLDAE